MSVIIMITKNVFLMINFIMIDVVAISICPYVFSCKMFVKSDFFVYSPSEHNSDEKKRDCIFF